VRAGATGGDGSLQKPFADPWQPLEKCEAGDSIHVAEGKYFGKNSTAQWKVTFDNVSLLGGYDKDFKERNPWKHPTQLRYDEESKNWPKEDRFISTGDNTTFDGSSSTSKTSAPTRTSRSLAGARSPATTR
jgi:hypothetical protein